MEHPSRIAQALEIDVVRTFVAICEAGNFSKAAERVNRTPSAVSLQVKKLEDALGRTLFHRETRKVTLTGDGETLLFYARRLLSLNDETVARFLVPQIEGRVRLGAPNDSGIIALPAFLKRFASTHPHVDVDVVLDTSCGLRRRIVSGEVDLVLYAGPEIAGSRTVMTEDLVWVGHRQGDAMRRRPLPLAMAETGCSWRAKALLELGGADIAYRIAYCSEHCQGQIAAVEADLAVAPLPLSVAVGSLVRLGEDAGLPDLGRYSVYLKTREGAGEATEAFARHILGSFVEASGRGLRLFA